MRVVSKRFYLPTRRTCRGRDALGLCLKLALAATDEGDAWLARSTSASFKRRMATEGARVDQRGISNGANLVPSSAGPVGAVGVHVQ